MSFNKKSREEFFKKAKKKVTIAISSRDNILIQTAGAVDEMNKASNLLFERLNEWYGMHFPELKPGENPQYVEFVLNIDRKNPDYQELEKIFGGKAKGIEDKARASVGADLNEEDLSKIRALAQQIKLLWKLRDETEKYEEKIAVELCPNISHLVGPLLAAKLVAKAGGLEKLARFPASTVQVLGAEKALFKHLRSGSKPPKHGLIFQHAAISTSPKKIRGKIARLLATQIAIASKADGISHNFIAVKLKEKLDAKLKRIMEKG